MALRVYNGPAEAGANAIVDTVDDGPGAGRVEIRTGAQPAVNGALTGTLLSDFTLGDPAYGNAAAAGSGAIATANGLPITDAAAAAAGTAGYGTLLDSTGAVKWTGTVTATGGGGDFEIDNVLIALDQEVQLTALSFNLGQIGA